MLDARGITVTYQDGDSTLTALDEVCLTAQPGEMVGITGASGSGKSTLLSVLGLLLTPDEGEVHIGDERVSWDDKARLTAIRREEIGLVFQSPNLLSSLTVLDQLLATQHLGGAKIPGARDKAMGLLERVGLADKAGAHIEHLSGGQAQRVGIARALMRSPSVLLADEPTSALDSARSIEVIDLLAEITEDERVSCLVVTHEDDLLDHMTRAVTIRDGHLD